ncbi:MAG: PHP domain-containing protein [Candidatus Hydrogenedentes bacterium]|nr:PHP domain-containing protein [Candidatus Hydrogenedentota bacterium]
MHLHTNHSDGSDAPARVVERAAELGLAAVAITDHDTTSGVAEAEEAAKHHGLGFLRAVEISAGCGGAEVHIVGMGINPDNPELQAVLESLRTSRNARADRIIERLDGLGIHVDRTRIEAEACGAVGRMHIARELLRLEKSKTVQGAFDKYIGRGQPAYVPKWTVSCEQAIDCIHQASGLAILAHPGLRSVKQLLAKLLCFPFDGIEAYHVQHSPGQVTQFLDLAKERDFIVSGGSDCHGRAKGMKPEMGKVRLPFEHFEHIERELADRLAH